MHDEWVADFARTGGVSRLIRTRWTGKQRPSDTYRWPNDLPLRASDDALHVNWGWLTTTAADGEVLYRSSWANSLPIHATTVVAVVAAGRSCWKIENENNNTLKTKGYRFEHNYGHGKQHLAAELASLILLAFLLHTVLERQDPRYPAVRHHHLPSRPTVFEHLRVLGQYLPFASWDHLWDLMFEALQPAEPPPLPQATARRRQY